MSKLGQRLALLLLTGNVVVHFVAIASATAQAPYALRHTLFNPSPGASSNDYFGYAIALSGTHFVVGAPYDGTRAQYAGSVHVFDLADATPAATSITLTNSSLRAPEYFGWAVAISGNHVVVGDVWDVTQVNDPWGPVVFDGSAHVYDMNSATPGVPVFKLTNPRQYSYDDFGRSVAISDSLAVVGAPQDSTTGEYAGSAHVFDIARTNSNVPVATFNNPNPTNDDGFGVVVAISGSRVVVGAPVGFNAPPYAGSAYVYDLASAAPNVPVTTLTNPSPNSQTLFGYAVAIAGNRVVVGASRDGSGPLVTGRAYVYDLDSATPAVPATVLRHPIQRNGNSFGGSVAISGTRVVIGASENSVAALNTGIAYVFDLTGVSPTNPVAKLTRPTLSSNDGFGGQVAVDGCTIAVGAWLDDTIATDQGAAYVFTVGPTLRITPAAPGLATLSWTPATSSGFALQYADALAPTNWFNALSGETNPVTLSLTNSARFYRLRGP